MTSEEIRDAIYAYSVKHSTARSELMLFVGRDCVEAYDRIRHDPRAYGMQDVSAMMDEGIVGILIFPRSLATRLHRQYDMSENLAQRLGDVRRASVVAVNIDLIEDLDHWELLTVAKQDVVDAMRAMVACPCTDDPCEHSVTVANTLARLETLETADIGCSDYKLVETLLKKIEVVVHDVH